jgi:hypothetical protein
LLAASNFSHNSASVWKGVGINTNLLIASVPIRILPSGEI